MAIGPTIQWILKYLLPFSLTVCMFFLIYKIIPNRRVHLKLALQAALFAGLLWELAKHLFTWYIAHLAEYFFLWFIKYFGHFRFVGLLFFDDSRSGG